MKYYYISPFNIFFLIGIIYFPISLVLFLAFIFSNINCEGLYFCNALTEKKNISGFAIAMYILKSFLNSIAFFVILLVIYNYSVFYIIVLFSFENAIYNILGLVKNYTNGELITFVITFPIEILSLFIFLEMIELNFCGLNTNLERNIIKRAKIEKNSILDFIEEDDSSETNQDGENIPNGLENHENVYD